ANVKVRNQSVNQWAKTEQNRNTNANSCKRMREVHKKKDRERERQTHGGTRIVSYNRFDRMRQTSKVK
ncbi:hypothetical protein RDWZM_004450, partial [Blomia tropicalis]